MRRLACALAMFALVMQAFVLGQHAAAMAATGAEANLLKATLAKLGLKIEDVPCHAGASQGPDAGKSGQPGKSGKTMCPVCSLHSWPIAAVWTEVAATFAPLPMHGDLPVTTKRVVAKKIGHKARVRDPPARA